MKTKAILASGAFAVVLAACGASATENADEGVAAAPAPEAAPTTAAPATIDVKGGVTDLGDVLTGPEGLTLYGFTNDVEATSACYGSCADAWPPVIVDVDWTAGPGLDFGIFATTVREDGALQLVAGKWPLYYFAGDAAPGDANGQASGDVWFAVGLDGLLIGDEAAAPTATDDAADALAPPADDAIVTVATTDLGDSLVDADGLTLYGFLSDSEGVPTCDGACADAWPPVLLDSGELPAGLDPNVFSVVERADGTPQLKSGKWPLYRFAGDAVAGDVNGQGSGDVWFVAAPDGSLIGADVSAAADTGSDY